MGTRAEYQAQAEAEIRHWATALGLDAEWRFTFAFGRGDRDDVLKDSFAAGMLDHVHRTAKVWFEDRITPEFYAYEAAHEVLHVFFAPLERAIEQLDAPAKILLSDFLHARIDRLARVLSGKTPTGDEQEADRPPWESERA